MDEFLEGKAWSYSRRIRMMLTFSIFNRIGVFHDVSELFHEFPLSFWKLMKLVTSPASLPGLGCWCILARDHDGGLRVVWNPDLVEVPTVRVFVPVS